MLGRARRPLPTGTPLCILWRGWTQVGHRARSLFQHLLAWDGLLPACHCLLGSTLWLGGGSQRQAGQGVLLCTSAPIPAPSRCCCHCRLGALRLPGGPHWPGLAAAGGLAQALGRLPAPSGPSCAPARGSCRSSPPAGVPSGSLQRHWPVPGSPGPCGPLCLSLVVAFPCPSSFPESKDWDRDPGRNQGARPCCGLNPGSGEAGKSQTVWLSRGSPVTLPAAFPAGLWPSSRCHVGDKGTLAPGSSQCPGRPSHRQQKERTCAAGCKLDSPGRGRDPHPECRDITLGSVSAAQLPAPPGAPRRAPAGMALAAGPALVPLLGCNAAGRGYDEEQGNGVPQKQVAGGDTLDALGTPQAVCVLESMTFSKGPASTGALCGTREGIAVSCWGGDWDGEWVWRGLGLGKRGEDLLYGAGDLSCLHCCALRAGV